MGYRDGHTGRHSIRLREYDYSQAGGYFVTICAQNKECVFGDILDGEMQLNSRGKMILSIWNDLPKYYIGVELDQFVIMPNHIHGIVILSQNDVGADLRVCPNDDSPANDNGQPQRVASTNSGCNFANNGIARMNSGSDNSTAMSLGDLMCRFKTFTTRQYIKGINENGWPRFDKRLWQRNYYERIIRNQKELQKIREYIYNNPQQWAYDKNNPDFVNSKL